MATPSDTKFSTSNTSFSVRSDSLWVPGPPGLWALRSAEGGLRHPGGIPGDGRVRAGAGGGGSAEEGPVTPLHGIALRARWGEVDGRRRAAACVALPSGSSPALLPCRPPACSPGRCEQGPGPLSPTSPALDGPATRLLPCHHFLLAIYAKGIHRWLLNHLNAYFLSQNTLLL